jgi:glycosyltransferase involved in cell wall biosynthesis
MSNKEVIIQNNKKKVKRIIHLSDIHIGNDINKKVIYDCMDDLIEFTTNHGDNIQTLKIKENIICKRAEYIFVSSNYLSNKISTRYNCKVKPEILNNAVDISFVESVFSKPKERYYSNFIEIFYIGTIAEWFDFDLILKALKKFSNIRIHLVGVSVVKLPLHERLIFRGRIPHAELSELITEADALIMPFKITELIKSVNPVKLYEYIATNSPIITCDYEEITIFKDFVYRYKSEEEFFHLIGKLLKKELVVKAEHERKDFLINNTWGSRAKQIHYKLTLID